MVYGIGGLIVLIVMIIAIIDVLQSGKPIEHKLLWVILILLLPLIGSILYFLLGRG